MFKWSGLNQRVASQIFYIWHKPHICMFATHLNRKPPMFVSPVREPETYATDVQNELVGNEGKCVFTISSDSVLFKPSNNFLTDRSKAVLVLWILFVICVSCHIVLSVPYSPFNPHVNTFGEFIIYLHDENFSPATVKGYRSAISTTLKQATTIW